MGGWQRIFASGAHLRVEGYFDHTYFLIPANFEESRDTGSASARYRLTAGRHDLLFGADAQISADEIGNIGVARLEPGERTTHTVGAYVTDTLQLSSRAGLVLGLKAEQNSFSGYEVQPTARLTWTPSDRATLWAAVSRAVRTPVRIDEDLAIRFGALTLFEANDDFETETALAYEVGLRHRPLSELTFDVSAFAYRYDHLRSTEPLPAPATFRNGLDARSYGAELAMVYQPAARFFLKGSYRFLDLDFSKDPDSRDNSNGRAEGNDPKHVAVVGAHLTLPADLELDGYLRLASSLPNPALDGYTTMDLRLAWRPARQWEVSLAGRNLLDGQYAEFVTTNSLNEEVHRRLTLQLTWRQ